MNIENLSTLKIHKLTQEQYDRALAEGNIDPNAIYLTPESSVKGVSPHIGDNGNWWIGNDDTGVKAQGTDGEDGTTGQRGTGILKVTTAPASYTTAIGSYTPKYRIALSTVKTQSKSAEVLLGDIIQYNYYQYQVDYLDDTYAYISATRVSIRGATGADGAQGSQGESVANVTSFPDPLDSDNNIVAFYLGNGQQVGSISVRNGDKGDKGDTGPAGSDANVTANNIKSALGYTPADAVDLTALNNKKADKNELTLGVQDGKIFLFVGGVAVGNGVEQSAGVSGDVVGYIDADNNIVLTGAVPEGAVYNVKYEMEDGTTIDIGELSLEEAVEIINQIPISTDASGNPFVGANGEKGYKTGFRLSSSSGDESALANYEVTGFIPVKMHDVVRIKDITIGDDGYNNFVIYDKDKKFLIGTTTTFVFDTNGTEENGVYTSVFDGFLSYMGSMAYFRISSLEITDDSIITVNQEITENNVVTPDTPVTEIINQIPISTNLEGSIYRGVDGQVGYNTGYRLSTSNGSESAADGIECTGFIPVKYTDTLYCKNLVQTGTNVETYAFYDANREYIANSGGTNFFGTTNGEVASKTISEIVSDALISAKDNVAFIRIAAYAIVSDTIITVNQELTDDATDEPTEIVNMIPLSVDTDGTIYNATGYKTNMRINSSGGAAAYSGGSATGFIPVETLDIVYLKGMNAADDTGISNIALYDADKTFLERFTPSHWKNVRDNVYSYQVTNDNAAYIRVSTFHIMDGSEILTVNQEITEDSVVTPPDTPDTPDTPVVEYVNQIPLSIGSDGNPFNGGQGWKTGYRISGSSGGESAQTGTEVTGFIPFRYGDKVYMKNIIDDGSHVVGFYTETYSMVSTASISNLFGGAINGETVTMEDSILDNKTADVRATIAFMRVSATEITADSMITVNQSIV